MKKYLIVGCAGFIGSNFVYYMLKKYDDILLVNLDKLTYAGNLENLKGDSSHVFVQGDICDKDLIASLFEEYDFDYTINFAAESHVDRSIANPEIFVRGNWNGYISLTKISVVSRFVVKKFQKVLYVLLKSHSNQTTRYHSNAKSLVGENYKNGWFTILPTLPYMYYFSSLSLIPAPKDWGG